MNSRRISGKNPRGTPEQFLDVLRKRSCRNSKVVAWGTLMKFLEKLWRNSKGMFRGISKKTFLEELWSNTQINSGGIPDGTLEDFLEEAWSVSWRKSERILRKAPKEFLEEPRWWIPGGTTKETLKEEGSPKELLEEPWRKAEGISDVARRPFWGNSEGIHGVYLEKILEKLWKIRWRNCGGVPARLILAELRRNSWRNYEGKPKEFPVDILGKYRRIAWSNPKKLVEELRKNLWKNFGSISGETSGNLLDKIQRKCYRNFWRNSEGFPGNLGGFSEQHQKE